MRPPLKRRIDERGKLMKHRIPTEAHSLSISLLVPRLTVGSATIGLRCAYLQCASGRHLWLWLMQLAAGAQVQPVVLVVATAFARKPSPNSGS